MSVTQTLFMQEPGDASAISINDVNQGWLGDCYVCAPIAALALERPDFIENMIHDNGDGTQSVRLYLDPYYFKNDLAPHFTVAADNSTWITVHDSDLGRGMNTNNGGQLIVNGVQEIWPQVIENAIAQVDGGYKTLNYGGFSIQVMQQLTGTPATATYIAKKNYGATTQPTTAQLQTDLAAKNILVFFTGVPDSYGLVNSHAYTLTSVDTHNGIDYAHFRNPWGYNDPQAIPVSDLGNAFVVMNVGTVPLSVVPATQTLLTSPAVVAALAPTPVPTPAIAVGPDTIVVNASASLAGGMGAHFNLIVDGATIGNATVSSTTTQAYSFNTTLVGGSSAAHDIQVQFDNDAVINGQDRNLYLQSISVDGHVTAVTDGHEVYHATGSARTGFGPGDVASSGKMYWQGAAEFKLPATTVPTPTPAIAVGPDTIVVNASASLAGGMGAHFNLIVDGATIGNATVSSTTTQAYSFNTTLVGGSSAAHDIQVQFDNDAVINGQDRNLYLQSISVDGHVTAVTDGHEVYHATGSARTGFGPGDVASSGKMYWQGAAEFKLPATTVPTPTPGLVVNVSEDAYQGDAQFTIAVDGQQQGGVYTATASHSAGQSQAIALTNIAESFTPHDIAVTFLNDKWDGTPSTDRNLYVNGATFDSINVPSASATLYSNGTTHFQIPVFVGG